VEGLLPVRGEMGVGFVMVGDVAVSLAAIAISDGGSVDGINLVDVSS